MALVVHARLGRGRCVETCAATLEVGAERLDVVVKRPRPELSGNQAFVSGLLSWAQAQGELDHEAVVAVLESGRSADGVYVIQEHVDGVALGAVAAALRKRKRTLSPAHAVMIARRVAGALEYLAAEGRRGHGDLDPGEVLVSYRGEVRVTDARLSELRVHVGADLIEDPQAPSAYRAPELPEAVPGGPEADVYALALVLLEMLIGHPVWTAETMTVADAISALTDFTHIGQASPALTKDLLGLLRAALDVDPSRRPSAGKLQQDLQGLQAAHGLEDDELGLGVFVEAILPPAQEEDAATQLMSVEQVEAMKRQREAAADWDAASVLINPEIAARAAAAFGTAGPAAEARAPSTPRSETPARPALVAQTIPLEDASAEKLEAAAKQVEAAAQRARAASSPAPSASARAASTPSAPRSTSTAGDAEGPGVGPSWRAWLETLSDAPWARSPVVLGGAGLALLLLAVLVFSGGRASRTVKLRATSEPPAARLFVDGVQLGQTPFEQDVETDEQVELRFELDGHQAHTVSIGTAAGEVRYEARLVAEE